MANINARGFTSPKFVVVNGAAAVDVDTGLVPVALASGDTISFRIPAGAQVYDVGIQSTGTVAATVNVGYRPANTGSSLAANPSYFGAAKAVAAGARLRCDFAPITFGEDVVLTLTTTAAGAGTGGLTAIVGASMVGTL